VKALFKIDDPELEQALAVIIDRLAAAREPESMPPLVPDSPHAKPPQD
jgi:hypothetical protein